LIGLDSRFILGVTTSSDLSALVPVGMNGDVGLASRYRFVSCVV